MAEQEKITVQFCVECQRDTQHRIFGASGLGYCTEHGAPLFSQKQLADRARREREHQNPELFK